MMLSLHPDYMLTHTLWPIAPDRTINVCEWHFQPSELARPGFDPADCVEFWDMTNKQDWYVCELSQAGIAHPRTCRGRTRTARICSTRSTGSSSNFHETTRPERAAPTTPARRSTEATTAHGIHDGIVGPPGIVARTRARCSAKKSGPLPDGRSGDHQCPLVSANLNGM